MSHYHAGSRPSSKGLNIRGMSQLSSTNRLNLCQVFLSREFPRQMRATSREKIESEERSRGLSRDLLRIESTTTYPDLVRTKVRWAGQAVVEVAPLFPD